MTHPDGYIEIKDRSKDIIISGGENISSIEIEEVLFQHPSVSYAAAVAMKDERGAKRLACSSNSRKDTTARSRPRRCWSSAAARLAKFKVPRKFVFGPIERTSTGKVQKFKLRERRKAHDRDRRKPE